MGVALLALAETDAHLGEELVQTLPADVAPDVEFGREVRGVQHAVVQGPMSDEKEARLGGESDGGVGGRACGGRYDAGNVGAEEISAGVAELGRVDSPDLVS